MTGKRKRRERPETEWVITEHPELRIVPQELWDAVKARQKRISATTRQQRAAIGHWAQGGRAPRYLFSGLLRCGECGGSFVIVDRYRYGCNTHKTRGNAVCGNGKTVQRRIVEQRLLAGIKAELLTEDAYQAFLAEVTALLKQAQPDPTAGRQQLKGAERERDNIMAAIRQGIITPSTKAELERCEARVTEAQEVLQAMEAFEPTQVLPRAREIYRRLVQQLEDIEDVAEAREALRELLGEVRLMPADKCLIAEIKTGGLAAACQISLVAGAGFEPATFGL
ncbi:MAG: recombinase zinc beta ribbon domain-containing protein [Ectothiorhodospiraceae bacterium]|nr:recombinase zinc beta ribbon domain-containing protein [Ectothiorhodospiraceae bacterium]